MKPILSAVFALVAAATILSAQDVAPKKPDEPSDRKAAIFVFSREPKVGSQQVKMLEDLIAARVSSQGFQALTRDTIVDSISKSMQQPDPRLTASDREFISHIAAFLTGTGLLEKSVEDQLDEQSSVMRLAQTIGADLMVISVIESYGTEKRMFKGNDLAPVATTVVSDNLLVSYRLAFAATGGAVAGDSVRVTRSWRETAGLSRDTDDLLNDMFDEVAGDLAQKISAANRQVKEIPKVQSADVQFDVRLVLPGGAPLLLPTYSKGNVDLPVSATVAADVSMDGVAIGSVPGGVHATTGLHQIAIQSAGFKPWRRFVNVSAGQQFEVLMEMTPESYEKWKEVITFLSDLSRQAKLTDAEVKQMEAKADAMRRAGLIVTVGNSGTEIIQK